MLRSDAQALAALRDQVARQPRPPARATNAHVHSHHSFSVFGPPAEAVLAAWQSGVEVLGLNDFFTTAGHAAFAEACAAADLPGFLCVECIALDHEAAAAGILLNDPGNPGKVYLCGKGVTRPEDPQAMAVLARLREHQATRNRRLIAAVDVHFRERLGQAGPDWTLVLEQTPSGNTTERHVARAILLHLRALAASDGDFARDFTRLTGVPLPETAAAQQDLLRSHLLKAGKPCFVAEDVQAFPTVAELRTLFLRLGAIPTYPILGNPVTSGEADLPALFDRIESWGFAMVELITPRNDDGRIAAVLAECARRGWAVTDGTEHNTPAMEPLITRAGCDPRFALHFREGALAVLGHIAERLSGRSGYVDEAGRLGIDALRICCERGRSACAAVSKV